MKLDEFRRNRAKRSRRGDEDWAAETALRKIEDDPAKAEAELSLA